MFEENAREVIFIWVVLAGIPRRVNRVSAATLPISDARAALLSAFDISFPIFLMILFPKCAPVAIKKENSRTIHVLFLSLIRDADMARATNF